MVVDRWYPMFITLHGNIAMAKKMLVKLLLLLMVFEVLLVSISEARPSTGIGPYSNIPACDSSRPSGVDWFNKWHGYFSFYCHRGYSVKYWHSVHRDCKEDRIHYFLCGNGPADYPKSNCAWSGHYVNDYDAVVNYKCPYNGFITGVKSVYNDYYRDRRFNFRCCHKSGVTAHSCQTTSYQNNWDKRLRYQVPNGYFLVGITSVHDNHYEDRRYKFEICRFRRGK